MNLNHIDLPVSDIGSTRLFFEKYLAMQCVFARPDGLTVLTDESGFALTLSALPDGEVLQYPTGFHIGSNLDDEDSLRRIHDRMIDDGVPIVRPIGELGGALTFQCLTPDEIVVEFAWRPRAGKA